MVTSWDMNEGDDPIDLQSPNWHGGVDVVLTINKLLVLPLDMKQVDLVNKG
jgi:hypothetical protein